MPITEEIERRKIKEPESLLHITTEGLLEKINEGREEKEQVNAFGMTMGIAKRARQLVDAKQAKKQRMLKEELEVKDLFRNFRPIPQATAEVYAKKAMIYAYKEEQEEAKK